MSAVCTVCAVKALCTVRNCEDYKEYCKVDTARIKPLGSVKAAGVGGVEDGLVPRAHPRTPVSFDGVTDPRCSVCSVLTCSAMFCSSLFSSFVLTLTLSLMIC